MPTCLAGDNLAIGRLDADIGGVNLKAINILRRAAAVVKPNTRGLTQVW